MHRQIIFYIVFLFLSSCQKTTDKSEELRIVFTEPNSGNKELLKLFKEYEIVSLQMTEATIPIISSVFLTDSLIIVADAYNTNTIYFFDKSGNLQFKWHGEQKRFFYFIDGFKSVRFQPEKNLLHILSENENAVHSFDLKGNHVKTVKVTDNVYGFDIATDGNYYFDLGNEIQGNKSYNLLRLSEDGKSKNYIKSVIDNHENISLTTDKSIARYGSGILYSPPLEQAIYYIEKDEPTLEYRIDYKSGKIPNEYLAEIDDSTPFMELLNKEDYAVFPRLFCADNDLLVETTIGNLYKSRMHRLFINKKTSKNLSVGQFTLESQPISCRFVGIDKNRFIISLSREQELVTRNSDNLSKLLVDSANTNPILIIGKIDWR
jgi:hypothetical protein